MGQQAGWNGWCHLPSPTTKNISFCIAKVVGFPLCWLKHCFCLLTCFYCLLGQALAFGCFTEAECLPLQQIFLLLIKKQKAVLCMVLYHFNISPVHSISSRFFKWEETLAFQRTAKKSQAGFKKKTKTNIGLSKSLIIGASRCFLCKLNIVLAMSLVH